MALLRRSGEISTGLLCISIASGLALAYQYEPGDPFISTVAIEATLSSGSFWRGLHFWSSQGFLIFLLLHTWYRLKDVSICGAGRWAVLSALVPVAVFALFSGYVLKYDATGEAAAAIAEHLLLKVPQIGYILNRLLVSVSTEGVNRIYGVHLVLTVLLWFVGTWYHTRRVVLSWRLFVPSLILSVVVALLFPAPLDLPGHESTLIKGPWFFLGVQEMLRHLPSLMAGIVIPSLPVVALVLVPCQGFKRPCLVALGVWVVIYAVLTVVMWQR